MSIADDVPLRNMADRIMRQSLQHPENLLAFLKRAVPQLADGFDCTRARLLDKEFPLDDWRQREADLPFEIPFRDGDNEVWTVVYVLLEHQSDTDPLIPLRLLYIAVVCWDRQWQAWARLPRPRPPLRLRPVLPLVLYTGRQPWGSNRTIHDMLDSPASFHAFAPTWQPLFWNLAEQTPASLLQTGEEWLQALAVVRARDEDRETFAQVFDEAVRRLGQLHGRDHLRWHELLRIVLTYAIWQRPEAERQALLAAAQANNDDLVRQREIREMGEKLGSTLTDLAMAKGVTQGGLLTRRADLRILLEDRFEIIPEELLQRIEALEDLERLQKAIRQVYRIKSLDELNL
jgi:Putative transposase, YhgA-like